MKVPKVSVIVPVYNVARWLNRCVDSILAQTMSDFELLLIDDGSTDDSPAICDAYAAVDPRVRVFHKPNGGVSSARNLGLDNSRGGVITFCDSDDYINNTYLEALTAHPEADLTIGDFTLVGTDQDWPLDHIAPGSYDSLQEIISVKPEKVLLSAPWGKLFKKQIIDRLNLRFNTLLAAGEDTVFCLQYLLQTSTVAVDNRAIYFYERSVCGLSNMNPSDTSVLKFVDEVYKFGKEICGKYGVPFGDFFYCYRYVYPFPWLRRAVETSSGRRELKELMTTVSSSPGFDCLMGLLFERNSDFRVRFLKIAYSHRLWTSFYLWSRFCKKIGRHSFIW